MGPSDGQVFDDFAAEYLGGLKLQVQHHELSSYVCLLPSDANFFARTCYRLAG